MRAAVKQSQGVCIGAPICLAPSGGEKSTIVGSVKIDQLPNRPQIRLAIDQIRLLPSLVQRGE